jgi:hypothetical protein
MKVYTVIVIDPAGDIHELFVFTDETASINCDRDMRLSEFYKDWNIIWGFSEVDSYLG